MALVPICTAESEFVPFLPFEHIVKCASCVFSIHRKGSIPTSSTILMTRSRNPQTQLFGQNLSTTLLCSRRENNARLQRRSIHQFGWAFSAVDVCAAVKWDAAFDWPCASRTFWPGDI